MFVVMVTIQPWCNTCMYVHYITGSDGMKAIGGSSAFLWNVKTVVRLGKHSMPSQGDNEQLMSPCCLIWWKSLQGWMPARQTPCL